MQQATKGIFWLASYPKSGNTWFRVFLANLFSTPENPFNINQINTGAIASCRQWIDQSLGFDSADLSFDEIDQLRPNIYQWHVEHTKTIGYHKIHDAYTYLDNNAPLIPTKGSLGALYFIRNPLDVAISFANHSCCSIDEAIDNMGNKSFSFCDSRFKQQNQLRQKLCSWSMHVESWVEAQSINLLVLRYEDMKQRPIESFTKAAYFLQLAVSEEEILQAIKNAEFDKLKAAEIEFGFREKAPAVKHFFRKGIVDDWKNTLTETQIQRIIHDHGDIMRKYGYLDKNNNPIILGETNAH